CRRRWPVPRSRRCWRWAAGCRCCAPCWAARRPRARPCRRPSWCPGCAGCWRSSACR
ncbi:hypothetical protein HMPREF0731_4610, partial [Pseudoroseomonas cervicalis ATCC 49957]